MCTTSTIVLSLLISVSADPNAAQSGSDLQLLPPINPPATTAPKQTEPTDPPPEEIVVEATEREWIWYQPASWHRWETWDGSFELGINGGAGNADTFSLNTGGELKRETRIVDLEFDGSYARTTAESETTQDIAIFNGGADWKLGKSPWSLFNKGNLTFDKLRAFDLQMALNAGLGYKFIDTKVSKLAARFGSGTSKEFGGPEERWVPEAVFGADFEHCLGKRHKVALTVDYFPDWEDYSMYRVTGKASWQIMLDQAAKLSLKLEATDRYDSTPDGVRPNQLIYALLLLWKF